MNKLIPLFFFTALVLLLPHGTLETIAVIGVLVTGANALQYAFFGKPRRRQTQPRQVHQRARVPTKPRPTKSLPAAPRRPPPAPRQSQLRTHEVIYIGHRFYSDSHTEMGSMYEIDSQGNWDRFQIGEIEQAVERGAIVGVRKATPQEMAQAEQMLASILRTQRLRQQ